MAGGIVDTHTHVWPRGVIHPYQRGAEPMAAAPADLYETVVEAGVASTLIVPSSADLENGHALEAAQSVGSAFGAIALLRDPSTLEVDPSRLDGFVGLRVNLRDAAGLDAFDRGAFDDTYAYAASAGLPLTLQISPALADRVVRIAQEFPALTVVIDHLGSPDGPEDTRAGELRETAAASNVLLKLSAQHGWSRQPYPHEDTWPWCLALVDAFGTDRVLWGSNWPMASETSSYREVVSLPGHMLQVTDDELERIMGGTARAAFRLIGAGDAPRQ